MRFFAFFAAALPLVSAIAVPSSPDDQMQDTLDVIHGLVEDEKIDILNDKSLGKRWDVPGLNCGSKRAIHCAQQASGVLATCIWAVILRGKDIKEDTKCMGAITALEANLPRDCALCLSNIIG